MITVVASAAVALAMPGGDGGSSSGGGGGNGVLCHSSTFPNPECCATDVLGVADLDCTPREFSLRLCIERDGLSTLLNLQPLPSLAISLTLRRLVLPVAKLLSAASFQWYVNFIPYWLTLLKRDGT